MRILSVGMASNDCASGCRKPSKAEDLLRPHYSELIERVWADRLTDKLYELKILSKRDKDDIEHKAAESRHRGASLLLDIMLTRSRSDCVEFAAILRETDGMRDLGEKLLMQDAGRQCNPAYVRYGTCQGQSRDQTGTWTWSVLGRQDYLRMKYRRVLCMHINLDSRDLISL